MSAENDFRETEKPCKSTGGMYAKRTAHILKTSLNDNFNHRFEGLRTLHTHVYTHICIFREKFMRTETRYKIYYNNEVFTRSIRMCTCVAPIVTEFFLRKITIFCFWFFSFRFSLVCAGIFNSFKIVCPCLKDAAYIRDRVERRETTIHYTLYRFLRNTFTLFLIYHAHAVEWVYAINTHKFISGKNIRIDIYTISILSSDILCDHIKVHSIYNMYIMQVRYVKTNIIFLYNNK